MAGSFPGGSLVCSIEADNMWILSQNIPDMQLAVPAVLSHATPQQTLHKGVGNRSTASGTRDTTSLFAPT